MLLRLPLVMLAVAGLIALAGCGEDESDETTVSDEPLSVEQYTAEGRDALLAFAEAGEALAFAEAPTSAADIRARVDEARPIFDAAIDDLNSIVPPEEAREGHDRIVAAFEDLRSKLADVAEATRADDPAAAQEAQTALQEAGEAFQVQLDRADEALKEAGIDFDEPPPADEGG